MNLTDDPKFQFLKMQNPNATFKELKNLYYKSQYKERYYDLEYSKWQKFVNNELIRLNIQPADRGLTLWNIYKTIEEELNIDLQKTTEEQNNISKLQTVFKNDNIKKCFESLFKYIETDLIDESQYKIFNIYFALNFFSKQGMFIKIGVTRNNPLKRIKELNKYNTEKWELLGYISNSEKTLEKQIHEKFKKYNIERDGEREWFYLNSEILNFAKQNCTYYNDKISPALIGF